MKWLWNWGKPKLSNVDNSSIEELRNDLTTLQNNLSSIQNNLNNYLLKSGGTITGGLFINQSNRGIVINNSSWNSKNYSSIKYSSNINNVSNNNTILKLEANMSDNSSSIVGNNLTLTGLVNPTQNNQAATKQYVDNSTSSFTSVINNITSNTNTNTNSINNLTNRVSSLENRNSILSSNNVFSGANTFNNPVNVGYPTSSSNAATKGYVDSKLNTSQTLFYTKTFSINNASNFSADYGIAEINAGVSGYTIINAYVSKWGANELNGITLKKKVAKSYVSSIRNNKITISTSDNDVFNFNNTTITLEVTCVYVKSSSIGSL